MVKTLFREIALSISVISVFTCVLYFVLSGHRTYFFLICGVVFAAATGGYLVRTALGEDMPFRLAWIAFGSGVAAGGVAVISTAILTWWRGS